jgi:predicted DNA-binding helix-hairpin-helix protein
MNFDRIKEKLEILADAAKYDVSCSSSGGNRKNKGGLGNSHVSGICHSYTKMADVFLCSKFCLPIIAFTIALIAFPENRTT